MLTWRRFALSLAVPALLATACVAPSDDGQSSEDNLDYRSTAGQEFTLSTTVQFKAADDVKALAGDAKQKALVAQAEALRTTVTTAISAELDRLWPEDMRTSNAGVVIQFRQASAEEKELKALADGRYSMIVSAEFAGMKTLERKLPQKTVDGKTFLPVKADLGAGPEELRVFLTPIERSLNAYPKYLELFEGGLDIAVHVGGDHNEPELDIDHARSVYDELVGAGFKSPVARFSDLKIDSGSLTRSIHVRGKEVPVRVRIVHVNMSTPDTRQTLIDAYKASVKDADVVIYAGHAGRQLDYSGIVVAYHPARVALPASEFKDIPSTDKQQLYLFDGCETYSGYADSMYANPKRNPNNTDIITTGNFSASQPKANQVIAFLHALIDEKEGSWIPRSWDSVLGEMNKVGERSWIHVYGVHGIDDDPKVSPLADMSKNGVACTSDAQCGAPDSRCVSVSGGKKVCAVACADTAGCPNGGQCAAPRGKSSADDLVCFPR